MNKPVFLAVIISIIAILWIMSGVMSSPSDPQEMVSVEESASDKIMDVRVQNLSAELMNDEIDVTGRTQASRRVNVSAETEGQIATILVEKGDVVKKGQLLVKLNITDRAARVEEARQLLNQRQIQFDAAKELTEKGFNSRVRMAEALAQLETAKSLLKQVRVELSNINITAPFDGVINDQMVEVGDYVMKGNALFNLVDLDPIEITGFLTEKQMEYVTEGSEARAILLRGKEVKGMVNFIAAAADPQTRTFKMEMTLDNTDHDIREGLTASIKIPTKQANAYKISPSILSLSDDGSVGVKLVNMNNIVEFLPIRILKDTPTHLWIGGLPDQAQIITVGQEFVIPGQKVNPVLSDGDSLL